jgi:predicted alpha/beta-fold hydrolase
MKRNRQKFIPPWWLRGRHLQSCFNTIFPPRAKTTLIWEQLELPDGDFIDLCWAGSAQAVKTVVLLHGLEGSVNSHYIQSMLDDLVSANWRVVIMHFRTCSGRLNRLSRSYHAGDIGDLSYLMGVVRLRYPENEISAVGFSLGGNVLLHYLAKEPNSFISRAVAISVPFELNQCANYLSRFYQWNLLHTMKEKTLAKIKAGYNMPVNEKELQLIHDFHHFDDVVTAPLHGFNGVKDYYEQVSIRSWLKKITQPTLIIHALDDPLVPAACVPELSELSTVACLEVHAQGGHVGFVQGRPWKPKYWLKQRILDFLNHGIA